MQNSILPLERLKALLQMEHDAEREEYRVQSEQMALARR